MITYSGSFTTGVGFLAISGVWIFAYVFTSWWLVSFLAWALATAADILGASLITGAFASFLAAIGTTTGAVALDLGTDLDYDAAGRFLPTSFS